MLFLMSNSDIIQTLINQINSNTDHYLELIFFGLGVFGLLQWRLTDSHLEKIKAKMESELEKKYSLSKLDEERKQFCEMQKQVKNHQDYLVDVINQKVSSVSDSFTYLLTTFGQRPDSYYVNKIINTLKYIFYNSFCDEDQKLSAMLMVENGFNDAKRFHEADKVKPIKNYIENDSQAKKYYEKLDPIISKVLNEIDKENNKGQK